MLNEPAKRGIPKLKDLFSGRSASPHRMAEKPTKPIGYSSINISHAPTPKAYLQHTGGVVPGLHPYQWWLSQPVDQRVYSRPTAQDLPLLFESEMNDLTTSPEHYTGQGIRSFHFRNGQYLITQNGPLALVGQTRLAPQGTHEIRLIQSMAPSPVLGNTFRTWQLEGRLLTFRVPGDRELSAGRLEIPVNNEDLTRWCKKFQTLI